MILDAYDWLRALHVLSVIAWMAAMLYLPRLFVYHCGATPGGELDETLKIQERRLLKGIMNPAMIAAWIFGVLLIWSNAERAGGWAVFLHWAWMAKFALVFAMTGLHHVYAARFKRFEAGTNDWPDKRYRILNEMPFLLALAIVPIAIVALK
ncbi:CopD family protein [Maricaulis sp.]|jgi:putative membrane protein|uniref:CopD family protein n=1 Tax=Maricaulis sp. TaxID=1486257 RepID=UPI00263A0A95|nr:CopD family protein [Maricaulis sp.]